MKDKLINQFKNLITFLNNESFQLKLKKINLLLSFLCILFIYKTFVDLPDKYLLNLSISIDELMLMCIFYISSGTQWARFLQANYSGKISNYFFNWSYSKLGKYLPGGLMLISVRLNQQLPKNKNSKNLILGILEEQFLIPLIGIPALIISLFFNTNLLIYMFFIGALLIIFYFVKTYYRHTKIDFISMSNQNLLFIFNQIFPLIMFHYIAFELDNKNSLKIASLYLLSTYIGLFFIGVPAGIGIREAIFIGIGKIFIENIFLVNLLLKIRILMLIVDFVFGLIGLIKINFLKK